MSELLLHEYQNRAVEAALAAPLVRWIFSDEMGLGKTPEAITLCRRKNYGKILVVTPAIIREHWREQFDQWWPGHPALGILTQGAARKTGTKKSIAAVTSALLCGIQIVSYALLPNVSSAPWDCIIIDEAHRIKNWAARQARQVRALIDANDEASVLALTGTLIPNDPLDVWCPLDTLWPERFGIQTNPKYAPYSFAVRYSNKVETEYGTTWKGVNEQHIDELKLRLSRVSSRTTKHEVAHLLPPYMVRLLPIRLTKEIKFKSLKDWEEKNSTLKGPHIEEWLENASSSSRHLCIATHLRETARDLARTIRGATCITGDDSPEERNRKLATCKAADSSIIVCTYHSVGIGIDLTFCTQALIVELFARPETILQFLGRFSRLSGKLPSTVDILVMTDSVDERIGRLLLTKIGAINKVVPAGATEEALQRTLIIEDQPEDMLKSLREIANDFQEMDLSSLWE